MIRVARRVFQARKRDDTAATYRDNALGDLVRCARSIRSTMRAHAAKSESGADCAGSCATSVLWEGGMRTRAVEPVVGIVIGMSASWQVRIVTTIHAHGFV
jgi:hypothetical protein